MQAWPEDARAAPAEAEGPISWVQNSDGDAVRIPTEDVAGIPTGSTMQVTVDPQDDDAADPLHTIVDSGSCARRGHAPACCATPPA